MRQAAENEKKTENPTEFQVIDKRPFANLDSLPAGTSVEEKPRYPTFVEELMTKLKTVEARFEEKKKMMDEEIARTRSRLQADYERRVEIEKQKIMLPFLEVLDNLERAIRVSGSEGGNGNLLDGVRMTANLFLAHLKSMDVEPIPVLNQAFDPNLGQAVGMVAVGDESQDGVVVEEIVRGYRMGDQLLRPAQVRVGQLQSA
jgi:molecular chaperone GrpE